MGSGSADCDGLGTADSLADGGDSLGDGAGSLGLSVGRGRVGSTDGSDGVGVGSGNGGAGGSGGSGQVNPPVPRRTVIPVAVGMTTMPCAAANSAVGDAAGPPVSERGDSASPLLDPSRRVQRSEISPTIYDKQGVPGDDGLRRNVVGHRVSPVDLVRVSVSART